MTAAPFYLGGYVNRELDKHFRKIADAADLPVLLYNIPVNTKTPMNADLVLGLQNHPNIVGIKDSSGDWPTLFKLQNTLDKLVRLRGKAPKHTYKIVTKAMGLTEDYVSTPLPMLTPEETDKFINASIQLGHQILHVRAWRLELHRSHMGSWPRSPFAGLGQSDRATRFAPLELPSIRQSGRT